MKAVPRETMGQKEEFFFRRIVSRFAFERRGAKHCTHCYLLMLYFLFPVNNKEQML